MGKFPVTYDEKLKQHRLMVDGELLVPGVVPVDTTQGKGPNHLQVDADAGLAVRSETFVSTDDGNQLEVGQDGKLFVREVSPDSLLSQDKSNQLSVTDGIYYNVGDHLSEDENNLLVARDGKLFVGKVSAVSDDEGNILQQGTDSGALLKMDSLVSLDLGNRIVLGSDNKLSAPVQLSKEEGNFLRLGNDQMLYINGADIVSNEAKNMLEVSSRDGKLFVSRDNLVPPPIVGEDEHYRRGRQRRCPSEDGDARFPRGRELSHHFGRGQPTCCAQPVVHAGGELSPAWRGRRHLC